MVRVPTTLEDVARGAGVSMNTVSRVVNNEPNVAEDTRRQVLRVITGIAIGAAEPGCFFSLITGELTHAGSLKLCRGAQPDGLVLILQ